MLVLLTLLISITSQAQASTSEEQKLNTAVIELYRAMVDKDRATLDKLTAEKLTYGHSSGLVENKAQYIDAVMNGSFDFLAIEPVDQTISVTGTTAIVRHIFVAKGINSGNPTDVNIGCLMAFQQQKGKWKLLARQAYKL
tara:strand:+ start:410 stop:829 length:420 start_codon:yes stop_codon:yes gene_type:complete